jgi:hypothetical protein
MTEGGGDNATAVVRSDKNADAAAVEKDEIALEESEMARKAGRRRIMLSTRRGMMVLMVLRTYLGTYTKVRLWEGQTQWRRESSYQAPCIRGFRVNIPTTYSKAWMSRVCSIVLHSHVGNQDRTAFQGKRKQFGASIT